MIASIFAQKVLASLFDLIIEALSPILHPIAHLEVLPRLEIIITLGVVYVLAQDFIIRIYPSTSLIAVRMPQNIFIIIVIIVIAVIFFSGFLLLLLVKPVQELHHKQIVLS